MVDLDTLSRTPAFAPLPLRARELLAERASMRRYAADSVVWSAGDEIDHLAVVLDGAVRVVREDGGRQQVVHTEGPGGTLGEVPLFTGGPAPATVLTTKPTRCLIVPAAAIEAAIAVEPAVAWLLLRRMAYRVKLLVERLDGLSLQSSTTRLAAYLLARAEASDDGGVITLGMTQTLLAAELGTVREVVVRGLRMLRERRVVVPAGRGRLRVLDTASLRDLTRTDPDKTRSSVRLGPT
jgi:CRP-like cAMP-binding protein